MLFRRYRCPNCGGGLSRTQVHPEWLSLDADNPEFKMPLAPLLFAIALLGIGMALIHPALGVLGVVVLAYWIDWRYFSWFQCDACSNFYFGGQLSGKPNATRPWTRTELKSLAFKVAVVGGALVAVFLPLSYVEQTTKNNCASMCVQPGMVSQVFFNKCACVPKTKSK